MSSPNVKQTKDGSGNEPRYETRAPIKFAGIRKHFEPSTMNEIPALWAEFVPFLGKIESQVGQIAYGVGLKSESGQGHGIDYVACVEVGNVSEIPAGLTTFSAPALRYAVLAHTGHVSTLGQTINGLIAHIETLAAGTNNGTEIPIFVERYGERFDPKTGTGDIEAWIPVALAR